MASRTFILFTQDSGWRLGIGGPSGPEVIDVNVEPAAPLAQSARAVRQLLDEHGGCGRGVVLALPSQACLCTAIAMHGLPKKDKARAMLYRLEERLPLAAEDVVADFVTGQDESFGVCTLAAPLGAVVEALESADVAVEATCPAALLAVQHVAASGGPWDACVWRSELATELVLLRDGKPIGWYQTAGEFKDIALHLGLHADRQQERSILAVDLPRSVIEQVQKIPGLKLTEHAGRLLQHAASCVHLLRSGNEQPWIDLNRGGGGFRAVRTTLQRPLRAASVAAAVFLVTICAGMAFRGWQYRNLARQNVQAQHEVFRKTFPAQAVPTDIISRLASEERKLRALGGRGADAPARVSALLVLRELLSHLPEDLHFRLAELRVGDDGISFTGEARSHADAEALAAALRAGRFVVTLPKTQQMGMMGVNFTISANLPAAHLSALEVAQ